MAARGQTIASLDELDLSGLPQSTQAKALRYWFDDDDGTVTTVSQLYGNASLDVTGLVEGLHTLHYQVIDNEDGVAYVRSGIFLKTGHQSTALAVKSMRYWFDDDASSMQTANGTTGTYLLNVAGLIEGLHTLHYQLIDESNMTAYVGSGIFLKIDDRLANAQTKGLRYWFDDDNENVKTLISAGIYTLDVSTLLDGLHTIHYQVEGTNHQVYYVASGLFLKTGVNAGTETVKAAKLLYWFDDETAIQQAEFGEGVQMLDVADLIEGLHTIHYQVLCNNGQMTPAMSSLFLRMNADSGTAVAKNLRYWFDDEQTAVEVEIAEGVQLLDASKLVEGLHTIHYQIANSNGTLGAPYSSIFLMMNGDTANTTAKSLRYWFDDEKTVTETEIVNGVQALDAARLLEGLHTVHYQIANSNGTLGAPASSVFLKIDADMASATAKSIRYWFDDDASTVKVTDVANGTQTLDVATLATGLHTLNYQLIDSNGRVGVPVTRLFLKNFDKVLADGHNRVTKYQYWLNTNSQAMQTVELPSADNPYTLISLLPMQKEPIHSNCFHFEVTNGMPTIYAKNILHVRFHDAQGYFTDGEKPFTDYSVKQEVTDAEWLESGVRVTTAKPEENTIKWYCLEAEPGDSLQFKLDRAATIQLFAPSGEEVFSTSGAESVKWGGLHLSETGTYYLALHDVTATQGTTVSLDYNHIDKYAVLRQDVSVVGNGGYSTITFEGNGFNELVSVDLILGSETISSTEVGHESNATTSVTFDFIDAVLGQYKAVFHFADEDLVREKCVKVEEATGISIDLAATFNKNYLVAFHKTDYVFSVHNSGNMTAYNVPLLIRFYTHNAESLDKVYVKGYDLKKDYMKLFGEHYTDSIDVAVNAKMAASGDRCFFLEADSTDIVAGWAAHVHQAFLFPNIPPNSTKEFTVSLELGQSVYCYMWCPDDWEEGNESASRANAPKRSNSAKCGKDMFFHESHCAQNAMLHQAGEPLAFNEDCMDYKPYPLPCPGDGGGSSPVSSYDPNEIYGYMAESQSKAVMDGLTDVYYTIQFENDTAFATAAAHEIVVTDTLDATRFDLSTYTPTRVMIGEKSGELSGDKNFVSTLDMRPEINAIAQVEGTYDQQKGIAKWHITSLDPMTMEPTDDPMDGVLPVNTNGNGIGEVSYNVSLKPNLAHGTEVSNRAGIVFDQNETIMTPTWTNIIDRIAPESHVADVRMATDSTASVRIEATDELSGPWRYNVYVQYGSGAWFLGAENVPIDTTASVRIYEGVNHGFYVVVTDSAGNVEQKEAAREFTFEVFGSQIDTDTQIELAQGWNWISHNQQEPLPVEALKPAGARMVGQTEELIDDQRLGWMGDLEELLPTQMYKLQMDEPLTVQLSGRLFNAGFRSVPLYEGWNWLGYPVAVTMSPGEALAKLEAEEGDMLIGQDGMAAYSDGQWAGTLLEMVPGQGYMFRSQSDKNLFYNATAQASSRRVHSSQFIVHSSEIPEGWTADKRKYPNVMGVIATLWHEDTMADNDGWLLAAFCGEECRGVAKAVDGVLMMNVYGQGGEPIMFRAMNYETGEVLDAAEQEQFRTAVVGTMVQPYQLHIGEATGVRTVTSQSRSTGRAVYDLQGRQLSDGQMKKGVYVVTGDKEGKTQKVIRK